MYRPGAETAVAASTADVVLAAETSILRLVGGYLDRGIDAPDWAVKKLGQVQYLRADALTVLRGLDEELAAHAGEAVTSAYGTGARGAARDLPKGVARPPAALSAATRALGRDLVANLTGRAPRILRQVEDVYRQIIGEASAPGVAGVETRRQVTERALGQFAAKGVTSFTDRGGRSWSMEAYAEMSVRTAMVDASRVGYEETLQRSGRHLVMVMPGPIPCPDCDKWGGKILLLDGGVDPDGVADASHASARSSGHLFGPNCGCGLAAYLPGISRPGDVQRGSAEDYAARQEQRNIERHIREWKRREAAALTPEGKARARAKVRGWQGRMRDHLDEHQRLQRLPARERMTVPRAPDGSPARLTDVLGGRPSIDAVEPPPSILREQYEPMAPGRIWTEEKRDAILKALRDTPRGKVLADTLDRFQDGGSVARLRNVISKYLAGEQIDPTSAARAEAMVEALRGAPTDWAPTKLFRGMSVPGKVETVLARYGVGEVLDLNLTSFSSDRAVAVRFAERTAKRGTTRVMVELVGEGKRVLPIQNLARDKRLFREKEWVGGGRYRIVSVRKVADGGVLLRIEQVEAL